MKSRKGGQFERTFAKQLSMWFTHNDREDVFWRTHGSGGRATVRRKKAGQKTTSGQEADIGATDPIGQPLIDLLMLELKNGYSKGKHAISFQGLLENRAISRNGFIEWLDQIFAAKEYAGSPYWALIWKRDGVDPFLVTEAPFKQCLVRCTKIASKHLSQGVIYFPYRNKGINLHILPVDFLWGCDPERLIQAMQSHPQKEKKDA